MTNVHVEVAKNIRDAVERPLKNFYEQVADLIANIRLTSPNRNDTIPE